MLISLEFQSSNEIFPVNNAVPSLKPAMTREELGFFKALLSSSVRSYVEFGCGGSTLCAVETPGIERIWSVESDKEWVGKILDHPDIAKAVAAGRLNLRYVDVGPVGRFGRPSDQSTQDRWPSYYEQIFDVPAARRADLFLIDGRFRVACILETLLRCDRTARLVIHDFWNRPEYHVVLGFAEQVGSCGTIVVLRPKSFRFFRRWKIKAVLGNYRLVTR